MADASAPVQARWWLHRGEIWHQWSSPWSHRASFIVQGDVKPISHYIIRHSAWFICFFFQHIFRHLVLSLFLSFKSKKKKPKISFLFLVVRVTFSGQAHQWWSDLKCHQSVPADTPVILISLYFLCLLMSWCDEWDSKGNLVGESDGCLSLLAAHWWLMELACFRDSGMNMKH